ncbi:hypothetical protein BDV95DRAFT_278577 [Massariosphaeria phaeospora]|uniref:Uncharacterized protein n=1 Tax=Massariosphaeria phaeospora TaxID=100035 RepID=A0A7C8IBM2_9PLEO|nr:hypothetical protein BDV95DRAFT_278577 [Massariosphaeria phaeospora]
MEAKGPSTPSKVQYESLATLSEDDDTGSQRKPQRKRSLPDLLFSWWLELAALLLSLASLAAAGVLLHMEDGKPLTTWNFRASLNTVIATLGTVSRTTLAFAVSACIGQHKWVWFRQRTDRLGTFETFDEATRGPWGGTKLFFRLKMRHWAALGALVTIGTVVFDPFLQAVISTVGQLDAVHLDTIATIGAATYVHVGTMDPPQGRLPMNGVKTSAGYLSYNEYHPRLDLGMASAVYNGFYDSLYAHDPQANVSCATGNCTWTEFSSVAVCSSCVDVSRHMIRAHVESSKLGEGTSATIPSSDSIAGAYISYSLPYVQMRNYASPVRDDKITLMVSNTTLDPAVTMSFQKLDTFLISFLTIRAGPEWRSPVIMVPGSEMTPSATEYALYLCANVYKSNVTEGVLSVQLSGSWTRREKESWLPVFHIYSSGTPEVLAAYVAERGRRLYDDAMGLSDLQLIIPPEESNHISDDVARVFNITQTAVTSTIKFLKEVFGNARAYPDIYSHDVPVALDAIWNSTDLNRTFEKIALRMTNQFRMNTTHARQGTTQRWTTHVQVHWAFFVIPAMCVLMGCTYVLATIVECALLHMSAWKFDTLPVLTYGFDEDERKTLKGLYGESKGEEKVAEVLARFDTEDERLKIVI